MDCQKLITRLVRRISKRDTIQRGATIRVAEALGVNRSTVDRWIFDNREPRKEIRAKISELLESDFTL